MKEQTYLEDEDQIKRHRHIGGGHHGGLAGYQERPVRGCKWHDLSWAQVCEPVKNGPFEPRRASRKLSKRRGGTTCKPANYRTGLPRRHGWIFFSPFSLFQAARAASGANMFKGRAAGQRIFPPEATAPSMAPAPAPITTVRRRRVRVNGGRRSRRYVRPDQDTARGLASLVERFDIGDDVRDFAAREAHVGHLGMNSNRRGSP